MPTTTRNKTKLYHAEEDKALFNFSSSIIGSNQQSVHYISQLSLLTQYLHTMNFNPARTQYINQSPKLPRATGLASTGACSAPALEEEKQVSRIGRDIKHFFDCCHPQDSSMDPICSSAARNATQVESRSRRYPIASSNNTPSQPFFYESFYGQEENKKHLHCRDRHRGEQHYICCGTLSSSQSMIRTRRKLDSILKSVDDLLLLKSNRRA